MNRIYNVRVVTGAGDEAVLQSSTSVYANTELEARVQGAAILGVSSDRVQVTQIPDVGNPTDADYAALRAEIEQEQSLAQQPGTTGGSAYYGY